MKTKAFLPAIVFLLASLASCNSSVPKSLVTDDGSVRIIENPDGPLYICDLKAAGDTIDIPLSELVEDCRIVRFETSDEALFKAWWIEVSDNYICVRQQSNVVKLYDKDGKFLCNIGAMGNGPGEYPVTIYDVSIDERGGHIFLSLFYGKKIMMYGLDGKWIKDINLPGQINKPKIEVNADGTLSVVHMPFEEGTPIIRLLLYRHRHDFHIRYGSKQADPPFHDELPRFCSKTYPYLHGTAQSYPHPLLHLG